MGVQQSKPSTSSREVTTHKITHSSKTILNSNSDRSAEPISKHRSPYLDNYRTCLTALVIAHHASISYGGIGSWTYNSPFHLPGSSPTLSIFNAVNQTYFMASFFFLSGHFSSQALKRRSRSQFLKTKVLKLGVPALVYTLVGPPLISTILGIMGGKSISRELLFEYWASLRGVRGPVWYPVTLLTFDIIASFLPPSVFKWLENNTNIQINMLLTIVSGYFLQYLGIFKPLSLQLIHAPQYIMSYLTGFIGGQVPPINLFQILGLGFTSLVSSAGILSLLASGSYTLNSAMTPGNALNTLYTIWNETTGYLLGTTFLELFRLGWGYDYGLRLDGDWGNVGKYSYAAFLVHPIVLVTLQRGFEGWIGSGVLNTAVVGTMGVLGSWGIGWGLMRWEGVKRALA